MKSLIFAFLFILHVLGTPDCYDFSVTSINKEYMEILPSILYYRKLDQLILDPGQNCGFYTYGETFFKSYDPLVTGIYFTYVKGDHLTCIQNPTIQTYYNATWLYANSPSSD